MKRLIWPRSIRGRVLVLFAGLAVLPLLALGLLDYARARRAVEAIVVAQTDTSAKRAATLVLDRFALIESDALLLSDNAETQSLLSTTPRDPRQLAAATTFISAVWTGARRAYRSLELRDKGGAVLLHFDNDSSGGIGSNPDPPAIAHEILQSGTAIRIGVVALQARRESLLPSQLDGLAFGRSGYLMIVDNTTQLVIYDSRHAAEGSRVGDALGSAIGSSSRVAGTLRYVEGDSQRIAGAEPLAGPGWTVISSAALPEFTAGLNNSRMFDLAIVIALAIAIVAAFTFLIGRTTGSLEKLTVAALAVGGGDLSPALPPATDDEVGVLSGAFDQMLGRIRASIREIEVSRQLAVIGEFSAQLAHEIRNPLTSVKLNLQSLARDVRRGRLPAEAGEPLDISLREVNRLDGVVRGVLELARPRSAARTPCSVNAILKRVLDVHEPHLAEHKIVASRDLGVHDDTVNGDEERLVGLFTNLVVNAIDAQPNGGRLSVRTRANGSTIAVTVADDGPGVPLDLQDRIFNPFVTGKPTGTGLGLSMALSVAVDHEGTIALVPPPDGYCGAAFCVTLPRIT
jgi:signal transduction histidine kinase